MNQGASDDSGHTSKPAALAECLGAALLYILIAFASLEVLDISQAVSWLAPAEARVISGFTVGAIGQLIALLLLWIVFRPEDLRLAVAAIQTRSSKEGWIIAVSIITIEAIVMALFVLDDGERIVEFSILNLTGSVAPLLDGVTQEIMFRGYLMLRLARSGFNPLLQMIVPAFAFSAIHLGYIGEDVTTVLAPFLGTLGLGMALGWCFIRSGYSLAPVIFAHVTILLIIQPWLALGT